MTVIDQPFLEEEFARQRELLGTAFGQFGDLRQYVENLGIDFDDAVQMCGDYTTTNMSEILGLDDEPDMDRAHQGISAALLRMFMLGVVCGRERQP